MEIYLIRHTTPQVDKGVCYGQTDLDLVSSYTEEIKVLQNKIPFQFDRVYSSPLKRCSQLSYQLGNNVQFDDRLKELNFGQWENKKWSEIESKKLESWMADYVNTPPPSGESYNELFSRVTEVWRSILFSKMAKIAIITHAGVIRSILSYVLDVPLKNSFKIQLDYGHITKLSKIENTITVEYTNL